MMGPVNIGLFLLVLVILVFIGALYLYLVCFPLNDEHGVIDPSRRLCRLTHDAVHGTVQSGKAGKGASRVEEKGFKSAPTVM